MEEDVSLESFFDELKQMREHVMQMEKRGRELVQHEEIYHEMINSANSIILCWDREGRITFFNRFAQEFFGYSEAEILGRNVIETIVPKEDSEGIDLAAMMAQIRAHPENFVNNENENVKRDGERVWISWTNKPLYDKEGNFLEILSVGNDITRRKQLEDELAGYALTDALTGAENRRSGEILLTQLLEQAHREGKPLTVAYLDVNDLKTVNDVHGHDEGDDLIRLSAWSVTGAIRKQDRLCRMGGDEFLIIFPSCDEAAAEGMWHRIETALERLNETSGKPYRFSISHGFAAYDPALSVPELKTFISEADKRMYENKCEMKAKEGKVPR